MSLTLFVLALLWATLTLKENAVWVEVFFWAPTLDFDVPFIRRRYEANVAGLLAGWVVALSLTVVYAIRAPFRIRTAAIAQRRMRELEREVLELRTLPLRQQEEDEILAAEAHIGARPKKVMTEKLEHEQRSALPRARVERGERGVERGVDRGADRGVDRGADRDADRGADRDVEARPHVHVDAAAPRATPRAPSRGERTGGEA